MFVKWSSTKHIFLAQVYQFVVAMATEKVNFAKQKINSLEAIWGIKLKLCRILLSISLYTNIVSLAVALVVMATWNFHRRIMVKWKSAFIAISLPIFDWKLFRNVCWVGLYQTYIFCPNFPIWFVFEATKRLNLRNILKINSSEAIFGIKLTLCRNCHSISLFKTIVIIDVTYALWLLWQLKSFHILIMGKMKIG